MKLEIIKRSGRNPTMLQPASSFVQKMNPLQIPENKSQGFKLDNRRRSNETEDLSNNATNSKANNSKFEILATDYANGSIAEVLLLASSTEDSEVISRTAQGIAGLFNASIENHSNFSIDHKQETLYRHNLAMSAVYCFAYTVVFVVGLIGNSFVIAVVYRSPRMRTVTNFFIVNLAVADVLVIVFCLPATLMSNIFVPWVLGWFMCKTVPYIQGVSVAASVYSLVAVSLDRFLAIWWPLKHHITKKRARMMIVFIWLIALTSTSPWLLFFDLVSIYPDNPELRLCLEIWPRPEDGSLFFLLGNLILCYILPMILISLCYILIWIKVWRRHIPSDTTDNQMERLQQKSKVKVIKMLIVVVILFVLSWLPLYIIFARIKFGGDIAAWEEEVLPIATPIAQWLGSSNSCINPILYAFFNKKYRRGFEAILKSGECCGKLRYYESVAMISSSMNMRKSSYYIQNHSSNKRVFHGVANHQDSNVSYIYNHTGV